MKSQKFSISDILRKEPLVEKSETRNNSNESKGSYHTSSLPTPPVSPDMTKENLKTPRQQNIETLKPSHSSPSPPMKRKRDPIGQILDSLCDKSDVKPAQTPSAFSPIITSNASPQLSPLAMLASCDRRCYQTSPNMPISAPYLHTTPCSVSEGTTAATSRLSPEQIQYIHAQRVAVLQHHHQQLQHIQQQHRLALQQQASPPFTRGPTENHHHQTHILREQQSKLMAIEQYQQSLLANQQLIANKQVQGAGMPLWMALLQNHSTEPVTSYPVKEPRAPPPPRYQCEDCKKSYSTFGGLSKHKQFHCVSHVKKEFNCKYCDKCYGSLGALKMHIRTHTLPCKCKLCGKAFSRPWLLQGHVRTHTGEKPFKCVHCGRAFADRSNLRAHLQTHSDIKKYGCKNCTKTFSRMSLLLKHEEGSCLGLRR